ncbi:MAG: hypothetical protein ABL961_12840 [Vicinamibacterales bacterium]
MARIDWALLCDLAFFDRQDRLCVVGIVRRLPAPRLPLAISQMMLVARLTDIRPVEEVGVSVAVVTPSGALTTANSTDCIVVEMAQEYVLITLRGIPLKEEGVYRFRIALGVQTPVFVDVPVLTAHAPLTAELH